MYLIKCIQAFLCWLQTRRVDGSGHLLTEYEGILKYIHSGGIYTKSGRHMFWLSCACSNQGAIFTRKKSEYAKYVTH